MKYINKKILSNNQGILHAKFLLNMNSICKGRCEDMVDFQIERSLQEDVISNKTKPAIFRLFMHLNVRKK
jgi:RES domain-containing protein